MRQSMLAVVENDAKRVAVDPVKWLMEHDGETDPEQRSFVSWEELLSLGHEELSAHGGCLVSALSAAPDLRAEIALAYLMADAGISDSMQRRIDALTEAFERS